MITENLSTLKIYEMSQEQYDRRLENGQIDESAIYLTPDTNTTLVITGGDDVYWNDNSGCLSGQASHSNDEILAHLSSGGQVVFFHEDRYYPLAGYQVEDPHSWFTFESATGANTNIITIDDAGICDIYVDLPQAKEPLVILGAGGDTIDYTAADIYEYVAEGGSVIFQDDGNEYYPLLHSEQSKAHFGYTVQAGEFMGYTIEDEGYVTANNLFTLTKNNPTGTGSLSLNRKANTTIGNNSVAVGYDTTAAGDYSHAEGYDTNAYGYCSHAEGYNTHAYGDYSHAEGNMTIARRRSQHVQGEFNIADEIGAESERGKYVHIVGNGSSNEDFSNAHTLDWDGNAWFAGDVYVGSNSGVNKDAGSVRLASTADLDTKMDKANPTGTGSFSLNRKANTTVGNMSVAVGYNTTASGSRSHATGSNTVAAGDYSHAEGQNAITAGDSSHAEGFAYLETCSISGGANATTYTMDFGSRDSYVGCIIKYNDNISVITASDKEASTITVDKTLSSTVLTGKTVTVYLGGAYGSKAHSEGNNAKAIGISAHAEGSNTLASGQITHAEGNHTVASGSESHAEGNETIAAGRAAHAEGSNTLASGIFSHAEGSNTIASGYYSHTEGSCTTASGEASHAEGSDTTALGDNSHAEGSAQVRTVKLIGEANATTYTYTSGGMPVGSYFIINNSPIFVTSVDTNNHTITVSATLSTEAIEQEYVVYRGGLARGNYSHAEGNGTTASGDSSHAEGKITTASGGWSHAEGYSTTASGDSSHAEGKNTTTSGEASHAEGKTTTASGDSSHAEGIGTRAIGDNSHAEGKNTTAKNKAQHVQGEYNIPDDTGTATTRGTYAHIVGNGYDVSDPSNAHTLDWDGNAWFQGDVYVGSTSGTNKDDGSKKLATEAYVNTQISALTTETWTFTLEDGSTVTKAVYVG